MDEYDPVLEIVRGHLLKLGLPLRTFEVEFGPSQIEMTFKPTAGLEAADNMMLFRSAVKQICRRHGYHARSALGFASLPTGPAVEVEAVFEISGE